MNPETFDYISEKNKNIRGWKITLLPLSKAVCIYLYPYALSGLVP